jgi:hypothetical protein
MFGGWLTAKPATQYQPRFGLVVTITLEFLAFGEMSQLNDGPQWQDKSNQPRPKPCNKVHV